MDINKVDYSAFEIWPEMPDLAVHTSEHRFCFDMTCDCHLDYAAIATLADDVRDGLATAEDALRIFRGKVV